MAEPMEIANEMSISPSGATKTSLSPSETSNSKSPKVDFGQFHPSSWVTEPSVHATPKRYAPPCSLGAKIAETHQEIDGTPIKSA